LDFATDFEERNYWKLFRKRAGLYWDFPFQRAMRDQDTSSLLSPIVYPWYLVVNVPLGVLQ